jgi:hypothetical protein
MNPQHDHTPNRHTPNRDHLDRWLAAEEAGRPAEAEAEAALAALFAAIERPAPSPGFAQRVVERAGRLGLLAAPPDRSAVWWRRLCAAGLTLSGALMALVAALLRGPVVELLRETSFTDLTVRGFSALGQLVNDAAAYRQYLLDVNETLSLQLQTPGTAVTLVVTLAVSVLAFRALHQLVTRDRSSVYVRSFHARSF